MKVNAKWFMLLFLAVGLVTAQGWRSGAMAQSSYFASAGCSGCHSGVTATCNGCHAHGVHATSAKTGINLTGTTNKTSYTPGETVSVTINGGYRTGWVRVILYNQSGNVELKRSTGTATGGMGGGAAFPITLTAPAPAVAGTYTWKVAWYGNQYDKAGATFGGANWVPDPGNPEHGREIVNTNSFTVAAAAPSDATAPLITAFTLPATSSSLTVPVSSLTATDKIGVTGYMITTATTAPAANAAGWSTLPPATVTAAAAGNVTFYAWAKDAAGNVSLGSSATVAITVTTPDAAAPSITAFLLPATSASLTVPITSLVATDNVGVTGYLVNTSSIAPAANAAGWSMMPPATATAAAAGNVTFYAWAKDAAGNVSLSSSATVAIAVPSSDTVAPSVTAFTLPATSTALTIPVSSLVANDNTGVTGYLVTTSSTAPTAAAAGWSAQPPATVTATAMGKAIFYAWAKDAAGNVSTSKSATVTITMAGGNVPPVLTLSTLKNGAYTNNATLNISGTVNSAVGIKSLTINGQPVVQDETGAFTYALTLLPGVNKIRIVAVSSLGKTAVKKYIVKYDQNAPVLKIVSPADNSATAKSYITVKGAVNERSIVTVKVNEAAPQNANISGNSFSAVVYLTQGDNTIEITATDLAGNVTHAKRTITYDNTKPSVEVTDPDEDITVNTPSILLKGSVSDALSDVRVKVYMNGKWYFPTVDNGAFQQQLTFTAAKQYAVTVVAIDEAGNRTKVVRNIIYKPLTVNEIDAEKNEENAN